ncbi:MAG: preprotein translocase subunit SecE [Bacilli bacterium]|nr:preprotein translocase subunit SecE [Bacilli bacterium]
MAEVRKKEKVEKYNIDEMAVKKNEKEKPKKVEKKNSKKNNKKKVKEEKKSLWVRFRIFCHGVKSEFTKIHWPSKKDMVRYSIASIFFIIFCALFFYLINVIFALVQTLFN